MDKEKLEYFRSMLIREKQELENQLEVNNRFNLNDDFHETELSSYDNHPADQGTETFERGKDIALLETTTTYLSDIDEALRRMDDGKYGVCIQCGKPISEERLEAVPAAKYCIDHQNLHDLTVSQRRPIEEKFLHPPFGRTDFDEREEPIFDGEDTWQAVERYGSSDTPDTYGGLADYDEVFLESEEPIGYVEAVESFIVTDIDGGAGENYDVVRNEAYRAYLGDGEGEPGNEING